MEEHILYKSSRVQGRFALDNVDGFTLSDYHPIILKLGNFAIPGTVRTDYDTSWFVPEGGTYRDDRIELHEGMIVREDR